MRNMDLYQTVNNLQYAPDHLPPHNWFIIFTLLHSPQSYAPHIPALHAPQGSSYLYSVEVFPSSLPRPFDLRHVPSQASPATPLYVLHHSPYRSFAYAVAGLTLRYGIYGDKRLPLVPNTSRLISASGLFIGQVQVRGGSHEGLKVYGFKQPAKPSLSENWVVTKNLYVCSYGRQGYTFWLNKGSRIGFSVSSTDDGAIHGHLQMVVIKGENMFEEIQRYTTGHSTGASYEVQQDNSYYIGIINMNPHTASVELKINVSSKIYDTSKASSVCSTTNGQCSLQLTFPSTKHIVLATPQGDVTSEAWYFLEISFIIRFVVYLIILGLVGLVIYMITKRFRLGEAERVRVEASRPRETDPILPRGKEMPATYGTNEVDLESSLCCGSSDDLYDQKICVICYDESRNCFFTPCGHSAACFACATRIMEEENKACPICRRLIHRVKILLPPSQDSMHNIGEGEG